MYMKKFFVSTGLAAISVAGLQSANGQGMDLVSPKAWSIAGTLRGFYDDNYDISNTKRGSWGTEVSPTISLNAPLRQTDMGIRYIYGLYYYNDRDQLGLNPFDQTHQVDVWLNHAINERWKINFTDTFISSATPELQGTLGNQPDTFRVDGNNIQNHANISLDTQWTSLFGTSLSYGNDFYDYSNTGGVVTQNGSFPLGVYSPFPIPGNGQHPDQFASFSTTANSGQGASLAGLLNRIEQNVGLNLNWTLSPETVLSAGYTYSWVNYTGNEPVAVFNYLYQGVVPQSYIYNSSSRDGDAHNVHVGISHQLTASLALNAIVGVAYSINSNDPFQNSEVVSPTANVTLTYTYHPGSYVQLGVTQQHNATDVIQPGANGSLSLYQDSTTVFADINHQITDKLSGSLITQYGFSSYEGGAAASTGGDSTVDVSLNLTYQISQHFSADAGYNFDDLFSQLQGRPFSRNRVYLGLSANY
jgi:hypothetical protein